jgi:predicted Rossmann fold nucleotide-binding protein DprA/Smf involved in DNA uptake
MSYLNDDSQVVILLCSDLMIDQSQKDKPKPFTTEQWQQFSERIIISSMKSPEQFLHLKKSEYQAILSLSDLETLRIDYLLSRKVSLAIGIETLRSKGIFITTRAEKNYPNRLKKILKKKCPPVIYYAGDISISALDSMAIVGSRDVDEKGSEFTKLLSEKCVSSGLAVISGGALGVDSIAEETAINAGGQAITIVSDSLAKKIMIAKNRKAIAKGSLLMLSIVNPNAGFRDYNAMDRNKYIYGMSNFGAVVASDFNKGGTWNGAIEDLKNSWVPLFVRKENDIPLANHELMAKGGIALPKDNLQSEFDFKKWLAEQQIPKEILGEIQLSLYDEIEEEENNSQGNDLYDIVIDRIVETVAKPSTVKELAFSFQVIEKQMEIWLEKAVVNNLLSKNIETKEYFK